MTISISDPRQLLRHLFDVAVTRALPAHTLAAHMPPVPKGRTVVIGAGKAAGAMAHAVEGLWPAHAPLSGVVVTRYDHTPPRPPGLAQRESKSWRHLTPCPMRPVWLQPNASWRALRI